jgi:hypothetical protein
VDDRSQRFRRRQTVIGESAKQLGLGDERIEARLRVPNTDDVALTADATAPQ